jgi:hypothetical protein
MALMPVSAPIKIEYSWADGRLEWLPELAADMVHKPRTAAALEQLGWKRQPQSWDGKRYWAKG